MFYLFYSIVYMCIYIIMLAKYDYYCKIKKKFHCVEVILREQTSKNKYLGYTCI